MMVQGMYYNLPDLTVHPLPFKTILPGMWYFDGQFFYQRKAEIGYVYGTR